MRYSAFMHAIEQTYNAYEERNSHSDQVTKLLMKEIIDLCRAKRIEVIIAGLTSDPITTDLLSYSEQQGAEIVDISVDLTLKENNNLPFDSHPSAVAHRQYAEKIVTFLNQRVEAALRVAQ